MAGKGTSTDKPSDTYSPVFAFVYIFNLVIGVGALSLPKAFSDAGLVLGAVLLFVLAFVSYVTATFMVEAMANANAYMKYRSRKERSKLLPGSPNIQGNVWLNNGGESGVEKKDERTPLLFNGIEEESEVLDDDDPKILSDDYEILKKYEMGTMANMFYHPVGIVVYYIVICLYLYGDLAIYLVAIPKSIVTVVCPNELNDSNDFVNPAEFVQNATCFRDVDKQNAYYLFLAIVAVLLCPWTFFNLTRSKYLQLATTVMRNIAFALMICIAIAKLIQGQRAEPLPRPASLVGFPVLFGVSIYAFMCQHSLPGMITPMRTKRGVFWIILVDFTLILAFYLLLTFTGSFLFTYKDLNDVYTLNFFSSYEAFVPIGDRVLSVLGYYLALFPVFTLSTNFPIISITIRENLKALARFIVKPWLGEKRFPWLIEHILFPFLAVLPPLGIAFATTDVELLVSVTGSFPGIGVQYVIPATLAFAGKYVISRKLNVEYKNKYKSPFSYIWFLVLVLVWTVISVLLIIADDVIKIVKGTFLD